MNRKEEFYTVKEFAEIMKLSPKTIRSMCFDGKIRGIKLGREYRIPVEEIDRLKKIKRK